MFNCKGGKAMRKITVRIGKGGKVNIDTAGFQGGACKEVTKKLKSALGETEDETLKDEFYEQPEYVQNDATLGSEGY
jgi:hypothetical protein